MKTSRTARTALLVLLPILNLIQLYIIIKTNTNSVNEYLNVFLNEVDQILSRSGEYAKSKWMFNDGQPTAKLVPRADPNETTSEKHSVKWSRSVDRLQYLARQELTLHQMMQEYKLELQAKLDKISSWIEEFESSSGKGTQHLSTEAEVVEEIASHPFLALGMLRRFSKLEELYARTWSEQVIEDYMKVMKNETDRLPDRTDYEDAMGNIINLRYVYDLNITDLMNGRLHDTQTKTGLTLDESYEIALQAEKNFAYSEAFYWYSILFEKLKMEDPDNVGITQIEYDVERLTQKHNQLMDNITDDSYWDYPHRFTRKIGSVSANKLNTVKQYILKTYHKKRKDSDYAEYQYHELCAGHSYLTEREKALQICFYETRAHPALFLTPLKVEVYSWDPYLIRIYDVVSDDMIDYLRSSGAPTMSEAEVVNDKYKEGDPETAAVTTSKARVGLFTFLQDKSSRLKYLYELIGQMVGLKVEYSEYFPGEENPLSAEDIQIATYAFGGHYEYHHDYLSEIHLEKLEGNRLATFMIYLNDVTLGGHTAFPKIGLSVKPIRNTAVFWYNLRRNGDEDERTLHGGCPVIWGQKWIANVWIHSFASFKERKCSLDPNE